mmetsp:Transcript_6726/g.8974  ORF Transcript_6726/g.8974 Transcript_6726/m.8974 type:complete len:166 (-) Transcript_6726:69-566(-)
MFDLLSVHTYKNIPHWHRDVVRTAHSIPIVLVANKAEHLPQEQVNEDWELKKANRQAELEAAEKEGKTLEPVPDLDDHSSCPWKGRAKISPLFHQKKNLGYSEISVKTKLNLDEPFLYLIRKLLNDPSVEFVGQEEKEEKEKDNGDDDEDINKQVEKCSLVDQVD